VRIVAATAALAILIGAAVLTIPELIAGDSLGKTSGGTTLFGGSKKGPDDTQDGGGQDGSQRQDGSAPPDEAQPKSDEQDNTTQPQDEKTPPSDQSKPQTTPAPQSQPKPTPQRQPPPLPALP